MTNVEKEFDKKFPCINTGCDNNGTIAVRYNRNGEEEWEQQQCQYCFENRLLYKAFISEVRKQAILEVIEAIPDGDWQQLTSVGVMPKTKDFSKLKQQLKSKFLTEQQCTKKKSK